MKRATAILLLLMFVCTIIACNNKSDKSIKKGTNTGYDAANSSVDFNSQYIRTDGYRDGVKYPIVKIIRSVKELNSYYNENKDIYNLERNSDFASDSQIGFLDACDKYDSTYFKNQILLMVVLEEDSGSISHKVTDIKTGNDGKLNVSIQRTVPEAFTDDMAEWHILIEPESKAKIENESDVIVLIDGVNPKTQPTTVHETGAYSNITLTVPYNWNYETEHINDSEDYCISFWPEDQTAGAIKMWYKSSFGVCGTGLKEEKITLGDYTAHKGTYDEHKLWDYICFDGVPGKYVAMNENADIWWDKYGDEAMQILNGIKIAEGIVTEKQAIKIAKDKVTVNYDDIEARFDTANGLWVIDFIQKNKVDRSQLIYVTTDGKAIDADSIAID